MPPLFYGARRARRDESAEAARRFAGWFARSRYRLMESYLDELERDPEARDERSLRSRFVGAVEHAKRVLLARGVVTVLLALGAVTTAVATAMDLVWMPPALEAGLVAATDLLRRIAAVAGSLTVVLLVARLVLDRYLDHVSVSLTFIGMQIAAARHAERA